MCSEHTKVLGLQLPHVHLTVSVKVKHHEIRTSIIIRTSQNEHRLSKKFKFDIRNGNLHCKDISTNIYAVQL